MIEQQRRLFGQRLNEAAEESRVVVDIGGIGGGHDFESNGNVVEHGHKQAELQAERKDALCKAKKYEDQNVSL